MPGPVAAPAPKPPQGRARRFALLKKPQVALPLLVSGLSLALYIGLSSGRRERFAEEELKGSGLGQPAVQRASAGGLPRLGEAAALSEKDAAARERGAQVQQKLLAQYGKSTVELTRGGRVLESSARLSPEDLAKGAGKTVSAIPTPKEAKKYPDAIRLSAPEIDSGIRDRRATQVVLGHMRSAGQAQDVAPAPTAVSGTRIESAAQLDSQQSQAGTAAAIEIKAPSESGLLVSGAGLSDGKRDMREVALGGSLDLAAPRGQRAVNEDSAQVQETMAQAQPPPTSGPKDAKTGLSMGPFLGPSEGMDGSRATGSSGQDIQRGERTRERIAELTAAHVYSKAGRAQARGTPETALELGGVVFDGKRPAGRALSGGGVSGANPRGNELLLAEAKRLEGEVLQCEEVERRIGDLQRGTLKKLNEDGIKKVRAKVVRCRDIAYERCDRTRREIKEKQEELKKCQQTQGANCSPIKDAIKKLKERYKKKERPDHQACVREVEKRAETQARTCRDFNKQAKRLAAGCKLSTEGAVLFGEDCEPFAEVPPEQARDCLIPGTDGEACKEGKKGCLPLDL